MKEEAVVLYPSPVIGHLISMVELGKLLLTHQPSLNIHVLIVPAPYDAGPTAPYIASVSATVTSIKFHYLPAITLPSTSTAHREVLNLLVLELSIPNVRQAILSISEIYTVRALIWDFFCVAAPTMANELHIPAYMFFTSGAGFLAFSLYMPTIHQNTTKGFKDFNSFLAIPGTPPIHSSDVPMVLFDELIYQRAADFYSRVPRETAGIIANSFELLEARAVKAISDGLCVPNDPTPPLYCVGPLIARDDHRICIGSTSGHSLPECLTWLESQPPKSVVYLCFGSLGLFSKEQLREIAIGLEKSGQRFLWVVRNPPANNHNLAITAQADPDLDELLPEGFMERTKERGYVVKSWAPQVAVLNHKSIGGFVTHCGWNSVLEAVCAGVPMVAWPLYAEQRFNRVLLVEEMKLALPMNEDENGFVSAAEVEKRIRELMESEGGKSIMERTIAMKMAAKDALEETGSSRVALVKLVESWWNR